MICHSAQGVATEYAASTGEQLLWSGRPIPGRHALRAVPGMLLFGLPLAAMGTLGFIHAWHGPGLALSGGFIAVGIFFAVGLVLVLGPWFAYRRAQRTVYALTSAGARIIVEGAVRRVEKCGGLDLANFRCIERPDGSGDLLSPIPPLSRAAVNTGRPRGFPGFYGVPNVRRVEQLLRSATNGQAASPAAAPLDAPTLRFVRKIAVLGSVVMFGLFAFTAYSVQRSVPTRPRPPAPTGAASAPTPTPTPTSTPTLAAACDLGSANACRQLGWMLSKGDGIAVDRPAALGRNVRGCELGSGDACSAAAFALAYGEGVAQDRTAALRAGVRACGDGHHPRACAVVGDLLEHRARDGDRARALQVYRGCCTSGDSGCCTSASRLERSLP